jgi:hypothetical protein
MNHMEKRDDETLTQWVVCISPFLQDAKPIRRTLPPRRTLAELTSSKAGFFFMGGASGIQGMKADLVIMDDPAAPVAPPPPGWFTTRYEGGESLYDMTQRKLFEREAEASAEPVYVSQFADSVFNPTAGAWSGAGRIIDTKE